MTARAWLALLVVGAVLAGVNAVAARGSASDLDPVYQLAAWLAVGAMVAGIRINRPPAVRPWVVMTAGLALLVLGDALGARRGVLLHGDRDPSAGDAAHLLGYVLLAAALLLLAHDRRPGDRAGRLESWIVECRRRPDLRGAADPPVARRRARHDRRHHRECRLPGR